MANFVGNRKDILTRGIRSITSNTPIRQMVPGAKARSLLETQAKEVENAGLLSESNAKKATFPTTYGQFLLHWAATVGKSHYPQTTAEVLAEDKVMKFMTRLGGTFGSINGGNSFTIPDGTIITAPENIRPKTISLSEDRQEPDSLRDRSIHYTVTSPIYCRDDKKEAFGSIRALTPGRLGNVAAPHMLTTHNFKDYEGQLTDSLICTNTKPILNGSNKESDGGLKYRISKAITAAEAGNYTAIRQAALSVPGVAAVVVVPFRDGPGRANVYIKTVSSLVSDRIVNDVQRAINGAVSVGSVCYARKPYRVGLEISSRIIFKKKIKDATKQQILTILEASLANSINGMDIGQGVSFGVLAAQLREVDSRILRVGSNPITVFDNVYVYYPARLEDSGRRREKVIRASLDLPVYARVVAEISIDNPVEFS